LMTSRSLLRCLAEPPPAGRTRTLGRLEPCDTVTAAILWAQNSLRESPDRKFNPIDSKFMAVAAP
jgi:hypothetical protein